MLKMFWRRLMAWLSTVGAVTTTTSAPVPERSLSEVANHLLETGLSAIHLAEVLSTAEAPLTSNQVRSWLTGGTVGFVPEAHYEALETLYEATCTLQRYYEPEAVRQALVNIGSGRRGWTLLEQIQYRSGDTWAHQVLEHVSMATKGVGPYAGLRTLWYPAA